MGYVRRFFRKRDQPIAVSLVSARTVFEIKAKCVYKLRAFSLLPRKSHTYRHQGFAAAAAVVRACVQQLEQVHPSWEIVSWDRFLADEGIVDIPIGRKKRERPGLAQMIAIFVTWVGCHRESKFWNVRLVQIESRIGLQTGARAAVLRGTTQTRASEVAPCSP